jgi:hypothetical protein
MNKRKYMIDGVELYLSDEQIQELVKQSEKKEKSYFEPSSGQTYYYISDEKHIYPKSFMHSIDNYRISQGNCFPIEKEAEKHLEYLEAMGRIRIAVWEANEGWKPDWSNHDEKKYYFYYDLYKKNWCINYIWDTPNLEDTIFYQSFEIAQKILTSHEADFDIIANDLYNLKKND